MERIRAIKIMSSIGLLLASATVVANRGATAADAARMPLPDGRYANVTVEGRAVAMVHVKNGGAIVLVDTDGKKPRTWEEQFKRKGSVPRGTYDVHKTSANGSADFEDLPVDRQGIWAIDEKGNISLLR